MLTRRLMMAAMRRRLVRFGHCRGEYDPGSLATLAIAFLSVCWAIGSSSAFGDLNDCDWTVTSDTGDKYDKTKDEVEKGLVRELAIKLRQFDRCLDRDPANASNAAEDSASPASDGGQTSVANSGNGGQNPGDGVGQDRPDTGAFEQAGDPSASANKEAVPVGNGEGAHEPAGHATSDAVASTAIAVQADETAMPGGRKTVRDNVVEDDVARILREAAEKETDPTRRAALWKEYENYVKNL